MTHDGTSWLEVEIQTGTSLWCPVSIATPDPTIIIPQRFSAPAANGTVETIQAAGREGRIVRCWRDGSREVLGAKA